MKSETSKSKKSVEESKNVLIHARKDRRLLPNVPDNTAQRSTKDRRVQAKDSPQHKRNVLNPSLAEHQGIRYLAEYKVRVVCRNKNKRVAFTVESGDISTSGMLLRVQSEEQRNLIESAEKIKLKFRIHAGSMPEGYEMKVNIGAKYIRTQKLEDGTFDVGLSLQPTLVQYAYARKGRNLRNIALVSLALSTIIVAVMRIESILYFSFNRFVYLYSIIAAAYLLSRYLFGAFYKPVPINESFTPGVSIIIPCFNEEEWIQRTILNCINQNYPVECLEVIVVDDCSSDHSVEKIEEIIQKLCQEEERFDIKNRICCLKQEQNQGKREAMARGAKIAKHELLVFVDSDSFLDPYAVMNLVQPFQDPKMGGVTGRTDVANTYTNTLTKMQSVRYYIAFRIIKAAEAYFDAVTCLSGPLSCYRKQIVLEHVDEWLNQRFMNQKATFGDDRSMTNFVLREHRTGYQDTAVCSTIVPNSYSMFLKQQMRWKRSWLRESAIAATFMWRKEPMMAVSFYIGFIIPIAAPVIVVYNLLFVPIVYRVIPIAFLIGLLVMSMLMSATQLLLRRSSTWIYGFVFCFYYIGVLLWQMPVAWFTFSKSAWGTRLTPQDLAYRLRRESRRNVSIEMNETSP